MVCFKNGLPANKEYRHYHIKTVEGINDFASMGEVVYRRYKRLMEEKQPLPQLVIIDGGKGQLSAALESIEKLGLTGSMTLVGLAKREESLFFAGDSEPVQLAFDSPAHLLLRRIRDEVHRFGITFHRQVRSKETFKNELGGIPGIGEKTATELLKEFRSVKNIKTLTERELTRVIGASKARVVLELFSSINYSRSIKLLLLLIALRIFSFFCNFIRQNHIAFMKAIEFQTKLHSSDAIDIPVSFQDQLKSDQEVRVIVLIADATEDESWKKLTTTQFFAGYSDDDAVYDKIQ